MRSLAFVLPLVCFVPLAALADDASVAPKGVWTGKGQAGFLVSASDQIIAQRHDLFGNLFEKHGALLERGFAVAGKGALRQAASRFADRFGRGPRAAIRASPRAPR